LSAGRRLGVLGWPVAHSRSPAMHGAAFAAAGLTGWRYQLLPVPAELFTETARALGGAGFRGANVTVPHKEAALALADTATACARAIGAANTLTFDPSRGVSAENTDAPGLFAALGQPVTGATALVLGAGGSARAVTWALLDAGAAAVSVWNRSAQRGVDLARDLGASPVRRAHPADLLVNCTSIGRGDPGQTFKALPLRADDLGSYGCVVDMVYRQGPTELLDAARRRGTRTVDGLEVLVRQGALSFELWTGVPAPLEAMRAGARGHPPPR